jgi:hypothetical protein
MRNFLFLALIIIFGSLGSVTQGQASTHNLSKTELLDGIQNWRNVLKNIPSADARENDLQQEFLFRLQFLVERRFEGNEASLIRLLEFMKEIEDQPINLSSSTLSPFLEVLIRNIKEIREAQQDLWPFIQQFMVDNSLKNPAAFEETLRQRDYFNKYETVAAGTMTAEEINQFFISMEIPKLVPAPVLMPAPSPTPTPSPAPMTNAEKQDLETRQSADVGKLEQGPRAELPPKAGTPNTTEGQTDVGTVEVIDSQDSAIQR